MAPSIKNHHCGECNFSSSRKFNLTRHYKRKHENNGQVGEHHPVHVHPTGRQHPVQGGQTPIVYQKHVQEQQTGEQHPLDAVHHHPVQAQQARVQQQGGRVQVLYQQQVNNKPQYNYIKVLDLDLLIAGNNIEYVLQNVNHFLGCFPVDELPPFPTTFPKSMIINTQASTQAGEHWVALVLTETKCYYFDSFAVPIIHPNIHMYLQPYNTNICYLDIRIQDNTSNYCGAYCVCFVLHVKDDLAYDKFIGHYYSDNLLQNDEILKQDFSKINFLVKM
jgi:hypothetical protein